MSKLLLLTDTHFGVKSANEHVHNNMRLFYENVFFPYLRENISDIDAVVHLGDVFHDRRKIDTLTAQLSRQYFFEPMAEILGNQGKNMHIICGNHDIYFRDTLSVNALEEFVIRQDYNGNGSKVFKFYTKPTEIAEFDALFVPWITKENRQQAEKAIASSNRSYVFGHFELNGVRYSKVADSLHGDDPVIFSKFDRVFSGHFHYKHTKGNITYLGSATEQTWVDADTNLGFHVFDTETKQFDFFSNPYNMFENIVVGGVLTSVAEHRRFYRLHRDKDTKQSDIDAFTKILYAHGAISVDLIDISNSARNVNESNDLVLDKIEDTPQFIRGYVEDQNVAEILVALYNRAINEET